MAESNTQASRLLILITGELEVMSAARWSLHNRYSLELGTRSNSFYPCRCERDKMIQWETALVRTFEHENKDDVSECPTLSQKHGLMYLVFTSLTACGKAGKVIQ
jgi:hypothetical protein